MNIEKRQQLNVAMFVAAFVATFGSGNLGNDAKIANVATDGNIGGIYEH
jgi:hypothetical protein